MSKLTIASLCRPALRLAPVLLIALIFLAAAGCSPSAPPQQKPLNAPPAVVPPPPPPVPPAPAAAPAAPTPVTPPPAAPPTPSAPVAAAAPAPGTPPPAAPPAAPVAPPAAPTAPPAPGAPAAPPEAAAPGTPVQNTISIPLGGNQAGPTPAIAPNVLTEQWVALAKTASRQKPNVDEARAIAEQMAKQSAPLTPIYDVLADKASSPFAKALATVSLIGFVNANELPRLTAMTKPDNDVTTRACATSLIGSLDGPQADAALIELKADKERQVRFQALRSLAKRSPEGRKPLIDLYTQPDTTADERRDIVEVLSIGSITDSLAVFQAAAKDATLDETTRVHALQILGQGGNQSSLAIVNECAAQTEPSEKVRNAAKMAADAINARLNKK